MKSKILGLFSLSVLALVMIAGMASAVILANWDFDSEDLNADIGTATLTMNNLDGTASFTLIGNEPTPITALSSTNWDVGDNFEVFINTVGFQDLILKFDEKATETTGPTEFKMQYSSDGGTTFVDLSESTTPTSSEFGINPMHTFNFSSITSIDNNVNTKLKIIITGAGTTGGWRIDNLLIEGSTYVAPAETQPSDITACSATNDSNGDLSVRIKDIKVMSGFGDDENFWYPLDEIEVEIEVENNGADDIDNIEVEWGLYDVDDGSFIFDEKENDFNLKDGEDNTILITFKLENVDDFTNSDYVFYVWANAEIDDSNNTDVCDSDSQEIEIINDDNFVILDDIQFPETASCGSEVQITADVWNVGDSDQDEVKVVIFNSELGINKIVEIGDINDFDNEILDTFIEIPSDVEEKTYAISLKVFDEDNDVYETDEDNDESEFFIRVSVEGCSVSSTALVSASLVSGGKAGEPLVVKATITNSGTSSATYTINAAGYAEWADSASIDQSTFTLNTGSSKEVLITLAVNKDAVGQKQFNIEVLSGNALVATQPVQVEIQATSSGFAGITGNLFAEGNKYLWGIGILNVILIIFIIIVAVRVARK